MTFEIDHWRIVDGLLFMMMIIDGQDVHQLIYPESKDSQLSPEKQANHRLRRHLINAFINSIIAFLVWIRIISVLITTKRLGHMI